MLADTREMENERFSKVLVVDAHEQRDESYRKILTLLGKDKREKLQIFERNEREREVKREKERESRDWTTISGTKSMS